MWLTVGATEGPLTVALEFVSTACTGFFGILFSLDVNLGQPRCSQEGVGLSTGQGALSSLRIGGEWGGRVCRGSGRRGGSGNLGWYFLSNKIK